MRNTKVNGGIAQLGEHLPYKQRVIGSSPIVPTMTPFNLNGVFYFTVAPKLYLCYHVKG